MRFFGIWFLFACLVWADKPSLLLLESYKDQNISGWLMSEKMDGVRAYWDGEKLISRGGTIFAAPS
ncbi:MAG: DNA ligase, partial [Bacteroidia bacterium]|nr:DNA ligase [Bacteroidia bacterium]